MSRTLVIRNRQRVRRVHTPLLRCVALHVLQEQLRVGDFELALHLVAAAEMARVNQTFLHHDGSTDVITFDHSSFVAADVRRLSNPSAASTRRSEPPQVGCYDFLHGELFLCLDDAVQQAREFHTTWQSELVRYIIHGLLHLCGHDDLNSAARRRMKREENRLLRATAKEFPISRLARVRPSATGHPQSAI
jgi:probable rRNA maturation factor